MNNVNKGDLFHVIHKVPAGDSPYVKAKQVQVTYFYIPFTFFDFQYGVLDWIPSLLDFDFSELQLGFRIVFDLWLLLFN